MPSEPAEETRAKAVEETHRTRSLRAFLGGFVPRSLSDVAALVAIVAGVGAGGAVIAHWAWPSHPPLSWREQVGRACDDGYVAMTAAERATGPARLQAEADAEAATVQRLLRFENEAPPIEVLNGFRLYVQHKVSLAQLLRSAAASHASTGNPPSGLLRRIAMLRARAWFAAQELGVPACGTAAARVE
jgi:hypothetical protein